MHDAFAVHMLNENGKDKAGAIARAFELLLTTLSVPMEANSKHVLCPDGREMSLVKTKLEEAAFFAKKAMAKQPENQQ